MEKSLEEAEDKQSTSFNRASTLSQGDAAKRISFRKEENLYAYCAYIDDVLADLMRINTNGQRVHT